MSMFKPKARLVTRYLAATSDLLGTAKNRCWYGTCPVWAQNCRNAGLAVGSERVLVVNGTLIPCGECNGAHLDVPPPWND